MITLITGQPGAGKTLYTLWSVKQLAEKENREVYYDGIPDLTLPWNALENPEEWFNLPDGAIIVIDECQRVFRPRGNGSKVPQYVSEFETHRHKGYDIFLITQHPMLIDSNVRRLCGCHIHVKRAFGANSANIHEFTEVRENVDKQRLDSSRKFWRYPKEVFSYYKSSSLHTHKFNPPFRLIMLVVLPFLLIALIAYSIYWFKNQHNSPPEVATNLSAEKNNKKLVENNQKNKTNSSPEVKEFFKSRVPENNDFPESSPRYAENLGVVAIPTVVGCMKNSNDCFCYTQQSTRILVSPAFCNAYFNLGKFRDYSMDGSGDRKERNNRNEKNSNRFAN